MSVMTHTQAVPLGVRDSAHVGNTASSETLGSAHVAMIKRAAKFALMMSGFFLLIVAVMSVKYAAFFPRFAH
jgi:hypothetical protein